MSIKDENQPWLIDWPIEGLEFINQCPVCGCIVKVVLHQRVGDFTYCTATGEWNLWRCNNCTCAYINPRPNSKTIGFAYSNYYTHEKISEKEEFKALSWFRKIRRCMASGYSNYRFLSKDTPSWRLGVFMAYLFPYFRKTIDRKYRNLPKLLNSGSLLDIGFGSGDFLRIATDLGWNAIGIDIDDKVVENGKERNLFVYKGGVDLFDGESELFDVITMSHVIEHLHNPIYVLGACYRLLKPGGQLWIETPNIDSFSHDFFGKNWCGLETPRHLILFNHFSMNKALELAGFCSKDYLSRLTDGLWLFKASHQIKSGKSPFEPIKYSFKLFLLVIHAWFFGFLFPSKREYITVVSYKPKLKH